MTHMKCLDCGLEINNRIWRHCTECHETFSSQQYVLLHKGFLDLAKRNCIHPSLFSIGPMHMPILKKNSDGIWVSNITHGDEDLI